MAKKQKSRAQSLRVNGQTIRVSPTSGLDVSIIKLMVDHQAAQAEGIGEEYHLRGGYPAHIVYNKALAAALKAKGLIHEARAKSSKSLGDHAKDGGAPRDSLPNASPIAA